MAKKNIIYFLLFSFAISFFNQACAASVTTFPFYAGISAGYGSTTWGNLVPKEINETLSTSLPVRVSEGGKVWGVFLGYQVLPVLALEAEYMQYPLATLYFDPNNSVFSYNHGGISKLVTRTSSVSLAAKFMLLIPLSTVRAYSKFGAAEVHRNDSAVNRWRLSPTFGAGLDFNITDHVMTELATEYTAGYGQSELDPMNHYIPFLYSIFLRLGYCF